MSENPTSNSGAGLTPGYRYYRHGHHYIYVPCFACGLWWKCRADQRDQRTPGNTPRFRDACSHVDRVLVGRDAFDTVWADRAGGITGWYVRHSDHVTRRADR